MRIFCLPSIPSRLLRAIPSSAGRYLHTSKLVRKDDEIAKAREVVAGEQKRSPLPPKTFDNAVESSRKKYLNKLKSDLGPDAYAGRKLPTKLVLDSLKDMQAYRSWTPSGTDHAATFKDAHRSVAQLTVGDPKDITIAQLEGVISPEAGVVWRMIHQLVESGQPNELAQLSEKERAMVLFSRVHSIGKSYAETFTSNGARTLDQLYDSTEKEYGRKVSQAQKLAILHFDDMEKLIARKEVEHIHEEFARILKRKVDSEFRYEVMGSYRRGAAFSSDVDIVVYHPSYDEKVKDLFSNKDETAKGLMNKVRQEMLDEGFLHEDKIFSSGARKIIGLVRAPASIQASERPWRQVDIRLCPLNAVSFMLVGNTGDTQLMKMLRGRANEKGLTLNEYGMGKQKKTVDGKRSSAFIEGTEIAASTEKDIFDYLGLPYLKPEERSFSRYKEIPAYSRRIARTQ